MRATRKPATSTPRSSMTFQVLGGRAKGANIAFPPTSVSRTASVE